MKYSLIAAVAALALATSAQAQTSGSVTITSDYVSRGTTQGIHGSDNPAAIGYVEHQFDNGFYVAGLAANVDFGDDDDLELDVFAGHRSVVRGWNVDASVASINYPTYTPTNLNMVEAKITANRTYGRTTVGGAVAFTPDYFNIGGPSVWAEANASYALTDKLSVGGGVGRQYMDEDPMYLVGTYDTYNVGAKYNFTPTLIGDVRYYDTNREDLGFIYKDRVSVSLTKVF